MTQYKARCSSLGQLMTSPKNKSEKLSETAKAMLRRWWVEAAYNRREEFATLATDKGNYTEQDGLQLIQSELFPNSFVSKNKQTFEDDYFIGTPDAFTAKAVIDNKSSFNIFTFPHLATTADLPTKDYLFQMQGYMHLSVKKEAYLCYTLNNTPEHIMLQLLQQQERYCISEVSAEQRFELINNHTFTLKGLEPYLYTIGNFIYQFKEIEAKDRIRVFRFAYDAEIVEAMQEKVILAREYLGNFKQPYSHENNRIRLLRRPRA